jgi:hypothetical protein
MGKREIRLGPVEFAAYLMKPLKPSQLFDTLMGIFTSQSARVRMYSVSQAKQISKQQLDPQMAARLPLRILLAEDNAVNQKLACACSPRWATGLTWPATDWRPSKPWIARITMLC